MKSFKCILILLFLYIAGFQSAEAQKSNFYFGEMSYPMWYNPKIYNPKEFNAKEKNIQSQVVVEENYKKGKPVHEVVSRIKRYDKNGNEVEYTYCKQNGKILNRTVSTYDASNNRLEQITFIRKRQYSEIRATYDKLDQCTQYAHYNKKGKLKNKMEYVWDSLLLIEARSYKKGVELSYKWIHEYNPDKSSKKTTNYDSKGKVKKVWTYDCNLLGAVIKKHEDTIKMCHFDSFDRQGYFYKIAKTSKEDGKMYKTIYKYSKDTLYMGYTYYDEKNRIKSLSEVNYSSDTIISTYKSFNKKGRIHQNSLYKQDKLKNILYSEHCWKAKRCDKKKYINIYFYDNNHILIKMTSYQGARLNYSWNYFYTFY